MDKKIIVTTDNSKTLLIPELKETYHSSNGAITESTHVFIRNGLETIKQTPIHIFEMGFGTGLNALLTFQFAAANDLQIIYHCVEKHPLSYEVIAQLDYPTSCQSENLEDIFKRMHLSQTRVTLSLSPFFEFTKHLCSFESMFIKDNFYHLIYYDAFAPQIQPELWSKAIFKKLHSAMKFEGILTTYCAQGQFKRTLKEVGFHVENFPGPPGKREITRGTKKN